MTINSSGNVGINTTSQSNKLEVNGNIAVKTTSGNSGVKIITASDAEGFLIFGDADDNSMGGMAYNNATNTLDIDCNNGVALSFDSSRNATFAGNVSLPDNKKAIFGSGSDLQIFHNGTNSFVESQGSGDLYIQQAVDDKDIIFRNDNGSGGLTEYFKLDGSQKKTIVSEEFNFIDNVYISFGTGRDLRLINDGSNSFFESYNHNLYIDQNFDDGDIVFRNDNGSGGKTTYMTIDGGDQLIKFSKGTKHSDNVKAIFGSGSDLQIYHDAGNSLIEDTGTGNLYLRGSSQIRLQGINQSNMIIANESGSVLLYNNNASKLETTAYGVQIINLSNTTAASETADKIKIGSFGAGRPAIFFDTSNTT